MTTPDVSTGGGPYTGGDVNTGRDFVGRDLTINGFSSDDVNRLIAQMQHEKDDAIRAMREAIDGNHALKIALIAGKTTWQTSYSQIDRITFAKEVHDLLQRITLAYNLLHPLLFEHNSLRPNTDWRWIDVQRHCTALKSGLRNLFSTIAEHQTQPDTREAWMDELRQCSLDLEDAVKHKSAEVLDQGLMALRAVIDTQPTRYNSRLGEAVDAMNALHLFRTLSEMGNGLAALRSPTGPSVDIFLGYVAVIHRQVYDLTHLRNVHHSWQDIEDRLRTEYAQVYGDPHRFRVQWQRRLAPRLQDVLALGEAEQSSDVQACLSDLELGFAHANLIEVREALWNLRSAVGQRFNEVDHDFKRLCQALGKNSRPLGETIAGLN